jgi:hypothetical protein
MKDVEEILSGLLSPPLQLSLRIENSLRILEDDVHTVFKLKFTADSTF